MQHLVFSFYIFELTQSKTWVKMINLKKKKKEFNHVYIQEFLLSDISIFFDSIIGIALIFYFFFYREKE